MRTHTKEKPFVCHCSAAFTRRDLLTRHQRIALHENTPQNSQDAVSEQISEQTTVDSDMAAAAAAASLSGMSMDSWVHQQQRQTTPVYPVDNHQLPDQHPGVVPPQFQQPLLSEEFFENGPGLTGFDHFKEFSNFLSGVGLTGFSPYFPRPGQEHEFTSTDLQASTPGSRTPINRRPGTPFSCWLPSAPEENRLAELQSENRSRYSETEPTTLFRVSEEERARLEYYLDSFRDVVDEDFKLPSRHALARYFNSYFQGFHLHMPFIHQQTWRVLDTPLELVLAIATIGAQYCFEHRNSERLFYAGKAVLLERLVHDGSKFGSRTKTFLNLHNCASVRESGRGAPSLSGHDRNCGPWEPINTIQALILLMGYATWEIKEKLIAEAFSLQGLLVNVLRDMGLDEDPDSEPEINHSSESASLESTWRTWVHRESIRRTKLISFTFLHTHSVAYNVYPVLRSNEIHLRLPSATRVWKAPTAAHWQAARQETPKEQLNYQDALSLLLKNSDGAAPLDPIPTPLGMYALLHGLLQRIHIVRDLSLPIMDQSASLPAEEVNKLERGLRSWVSGWKQAPESNLDPNNENGPIPFTSSSLLGLAYVRIYLNLGPYRQLETRDAARIARALCRSPNVDRSDGVISALLYATHALSIPVRLGVDRVARSQAFFWSVRHSLSGFDCAVLLSKWLSSLEDSMDSVPLTDSEDRILHWVKCIVEEAYAVVDFEEEATLQTDPSSLSLAVLKIWAHFFKGNTQWPFINLIGLGLEKFREMLIRGTGHQIT